jgi:hypothetical protein
MAPCGPARSKAAPDSHCRQRQEAEPEHLPAVVCVLENSYVETARWERDRRSDDEPVYDARDDPAEELASRNAYRRIFGRCRGRRRGRSGHGASAPGI